MNLKLIIGLCIICLMLTGCIEGRTWKPDVIKQCSEFCLSKNMTKIEYTGLNDEYINCQCKEIMLRTTSKGD